MDAPAAGRARRAAASRANTVTAAAIAADLQPEFVDPSSSDDDNSAAAVAAARKRAKRAAAAAALGASSAAAAAPLTARTAAHSDAPAAVPAAAAAALAVVPDADDSDAGMADPLEPLVEPRGIEALGWDTVRLRQLADGVPFGGHTTAGGWSSRAGTSRGSSAASASSRSIAAASPPSVSTSSAAAATAAVVPLVDGPPGSTPAAIWQRHTGTPPEADWLRDALRGVATRGNGPYPDSVAHDISRSGKRIDGMLVAL